VALAEDLRGELDSLALPDLASGVSVAPHQLLRELHVTEHDRHLVHGLLPTVVLELLKEKLLSFQVH